MRCAARALRVLLAAALIAPSSALAQSRAAQPVRLAPGLSAMSAAPQPIATFGMVAESLAVPLALPAVLSAVPALAPVPVLAAAAPTAFESLSAMPAAAADGAGRRFDGEVEGPEDAASPEIIDTAAAAPALYEQLELWFTRKDRKELSKDNVYALIRPVFDAAEKKGDRVSYSQWYWEKYQKGRSVYVKTGNQTMFVSRVAEASTKRIAELDRKDFEGFYTPALMKGKSTKQLRARLIDELTQRNILKGKGAKGVMSADSFVRVVKVLPFNTARLLPENTEGSGLAALPRREIALPAALQGLNHMLPKAVLVDMRLFKDSVPYALIEDMSKLMKAGVYFILLSDKRSEGPGSAEDLLTRGLTTKQRDQVSRYKLVTLTDDGNALQSFDGSFARFHSSKSFSGQEQELMQFAARLTGLSGTVGAHGTEFNIDVTGRGAALAGELIANMSKLGLPSGQWHFSSSELNGRATLTVRPQNLVSALPHLFETLRDEQDLYVLPSDVMTISRDDALLGAMKGSLQPAAHLDAQGAELVDASLASLLGPYRENKPGDLASSASKIASLKREGKGFGDGGSIFMMMGHVMHASFNWALWKYRQEGVLPAAEDLAEIAERKWDREIGAATRNLLDRSGKRLAGYHGEMLSRLKVMYGYLAKEIAQYPIVIGSELPNLFVVERFKKGEPLNRDIFRLIFDLALARETPAGLEVAVLDFKTGQTPMLQNLEKDTQVQLYDTIVRQMWQRLPLPYGGTGALKDAVDFIIRFIYPTGMRQPILNEWTRISFGGFLRNQVNKLRKLATPPDPEKEKAKAKAARLIGRVDPSRPETAGFDTLVLPRVVPGLKIKKEFAQQIIKGTKTSESRGVPTKPKPFVALIQTFTDEEPGRPAEVVGFARIEKVTGKSGAFEWHLSHVTRVKPYVLRNDKPGAVLWVKDVPVSGPRRLKKS